MRAPHQASDKRFYKRHEFQSVPMEEYEVRDVTRRNETPDLQMSLTLKGGSSSLRPANVGEVLNTPINARVSNLAIAPACYALFTVYLDPRLILNTSVRVKHTGEVRMRIASEVHVVQSPSFEWSTANQLPIWMGLDQYLPGLSVRFQNLGPSVERSFVLGWEAHAPGMSRRRGVGLLQWDGSELCLANDPVGVEFVDE